MIAALLFAIAHAHVGTHVGKGILRAIVGDAAENRPGNPSREVTQVTAW